MALAECLAAQERHAEAKELLVASHAAFQKKLGDQDPRTQQAHALLAKLSEAPENPASAENP
jgi:hypothetical protein